VTLRSIAHSRTGDKGSTLTVSVIAYREEDYPRLVRVVTAARVERELAWIARGPVERHEMPAIAALTFVVARAPRDNVTQTLALDPHGKTVSSVLLDMEMDDR
jgi:hypothetical protein